jgi:hypothetical protein
MKACARSLAVVLVVALGGCGSGEAAKPTAAKTTTEPTSTAASPDPTIQDVMEVADIGSFAPLEPGNYFMDPDLDPSTSLRVVFEVAADGWLQWIGTFKRSGAGYVGVSITTVSNLVRHGCRDHSRHDPPVGPGVDDLATALADLAPFRVTAPPTDVTIYGYRGKHLELTVPDLPMKGRGDERRFAGCVGGQLKSWVDPLSQPYEGDAYYGYTGPGHTEEFWILDVEGSRLVIQANWSPGSPPEDIAEMGAILDSIRIER